VPDFTKYVPPGVYVEDTSDPIVTSSGLPASVVAVIGSALGYQTQTETFPIYVFGAHLRGIPVQVNVLATMLFALTVTAICFVLWQQRHAERMVSVRSEQEV
jgi:hypothetical protein